jgi:hypothetical protein
MCAADLPRSHLLGRLSVLCSGTGSLACRDLDASQAPRRELVPLRVSSPLPYVLSLCGWVLLGTSAREGR